MLLLVVVLASVASAELPCEEPDTDVGRPSQCPPGQLLHNNVCRSYFQLRSQGKTCLLTENLLSTKWVPTDEVICPLKEKTSDCALFKAFTVDCVYFFSSVSEHPPCKKFKAEEEYKIIDNICTELTAGMPPTGRKINNKLWFPAIVPPLPGGQCPALYCPTNNGTCIKGRTFNALSPEIFGGVDRITTFIHEESVNETKEVKNLSALFRNTMRISGGRKR